MSSGLATTNTVRMVAFSNQHQVRWGRMEAVTNASTIRPRPIFITSFTSIFGVLPIVIGSGAERNTNARVDLRPRDERYPGFF